MSHSTRILGNAVKDACAAIAADWPKQVNKINNSNEKSNDTSSATTAKN